MIKKTKKEIKSLLTSDKSVTIFIIIGLCAIVFIFFSSQNSGENIEDITDNFNTQTYHNALTAEILNMVESVEGAGKAKIMLTLETSYEYEYLDDDKTLKKVNEPTIRGVGVACEGGDNPLVAAKITELLKTVLNIPGNKVCVSKLT